jgi:hypothetical protein
MHGAECAVGCLLGLNPPSGAGGLDRDVLLVQSQLRSNETRRTFFGFV